MPRTGFSQLRKIVTCSNPCQWLEKPLCLAGLHYRGNEPAGTFKQVSLTYMIFEPQTPGSLSLLRYSQHDKTLDI